MITNYGYDCDDHNMADYEVEAMSKIIFFDLDGTLRQTKSGKTWSYYQNKGFICIGITNQGGVAAGHKSLQDAIEEQRITLELFPELSEIFFCPNYGGENCWQVSQGNVPLEFSAPLWGGEKMISCRKPGHGMLAVAAHSLADLSDCWMIGDRTEDEACAAAAGVKFIWASILHNRFAGPGMREMDCQHINPNVLTEFLSL